MTARKFVGGRPPLFGTNRAPKGEGFQKRSPWYWWYQYLRRNPDYLLACRNGGLGPLATLYADFGDVRKDDFRTWWTTGDRGAKLFGEPPMPRVEVVDPSGEFSLGSNELLVRIPLTLAKKFIQDRLTAILDAKHQGARGVRNFNTSRALYPLHGRYQVIALEKALAVYDLRMQHPTMPLWSIAQTAEVTSRKHHVSNSDPEATKRAKKLNLSNLAHRHLKKARALIGNVRDGRFPDFR